eukprot:GDKI01043578.1.p1 GENE.GDKI01043578.1~~GDKI01043578.1.p1  ORF type:complete len:250 (+),score=80.68 GDKI01043578.1:95-844(+)
MFLSLNPKHDNVAFGQSLSAEEAEQVLKDDLKLATTWCVWEQVAASSAKDKYDDATRKFATFSSVQEFWRLWNYMPQPSELLEQKRMVRETSDSHHLIDAIMVFREGVKPQWEDPANANGGHFQFVFRQPQTAPAPKDKEAPSPSVGGEEKKAKDPGYAQVDEYWNNLVLGLIGNTIEPHGAITGVRLVDKLSGSRANAMLRVEVWFQTIDDKETVEALRKNVEKCMSTKLDGSAGPKPNSEIKSHKSH